MLSAWFCHRRLYVDFSHTKRDDIASVEEKACDLLRGRFCFSPCTVSDPFCLQKEAEAVREMQDLFEMDIPGRYTAELVYYSCPSRPEALPSERDRKSTPVLEVVGVAGELDLADVSHPPPPPASAATTIDSLYGRHWRTTGGIQITRHTFCRRRKLRPTSLHQQMGSQWQKSATPTARHRWWLSGLGTR